MTRPVLFLLLVSLLVSCALPPVYTLPPKAQYAVSMFTDDFHGRHRVSLLDGVTERKPWGEDVKRWIATP